VTDPADFERFASEIERSGEKQRWRRCWTLNREKFSRHFPIRRHDHHGVEPLSSVAGHIASRSDPPLCLSDAFALRRRRNCVTEKSPPGPRRFINVPAHAAHGRIGQRQKLQVKDFPTISRGPGSRAQPRRGLPESPRGIISTIILVARVRRSCWILFEKKALRATVSAFGGVLASTNTARSLRRRRRKSAKPLCGMHSPRPVFGERCERNSSGTKRKLTIARMPHAA